MSKKKDKEEALITIGIQKKLNEVLSGPPIQPLKIRLAAIAMVYDDHAGNISHKLAEAQAYDLAKVARLYKSRMIT